LGLDQHFGLLILHKWWIDHGPANTLLCFIPQTEVHSLIIMIFGHISISVLDSSHG